MTKSTRRALLSSVVALVLCLTMLIGTTFAWFTDTASTSVNTIVSGTLDVELGKYVDDEWVSLEGETLDFVKADGAPEDEEILWEPGCEYNLEEVVIRNNGNLALKYKVVVTGINGDAKLNEAIEWTVKVDNAAPEAEGHLLPGKSATLTISGHMKEEAGNEYQGLTIDGAAITVYATQYTYEHDSYSDQYDANATLPSIWDGETTEELTQDENGVYHITNAAQFVDYLNSIHNNDGKQYYNVVLDCDIDFAGRTIEVSGTSAAFSGTFDGQNHTVSNYTIKRDDTCTYTGLFSISSWSQDGRTTTFKNLTVENGTVISNGAQVAAILPNVENGAILENCHAINCTVIGEKKVGAVAGYNANATVSNCSAENCNVYCTDPRAAQVSVYGYDNNGTFTNNEEPVNCTTAYGVTNVADGVVLNNGIYEIYNADGMFWLAEQPVAVQCYADVKLTADINLANKAWTPIGNASTQYNGTFDGNGHTIYGLNIKDEDCDGNEATGLFAWSNGTIKNLTIDGAKVIGNHWVGVIAGYMQAGTIENCTVKNATVKAIYVKNNRDGDKAGAVVGYVNKGDFNTTVNNCKAVDCEVYAVRDAGQIAGCANADAVTNCTAENVTVTAIGGYGTSGDNVKNDIVGRN